MTVAAVGLVLSEVWMGGLLGGGLPRLGWKRCSPWLALWRRMPCASEYVSE